MGHQIIKQPDGLYAVFSTGVDRWLRYGQTRDDLIEWRAERAAKEARESTARLLDEMDKEPEATSSWGALGYTFAEANALSVEHGGADLTKPEGEEEEHG